MVSQTISINFRAIWRSQATKSLTFATDPGFRVTSVTNVLHPVESYDVLVFLKIFKDTCTRWKFIYTNNFHYFTYSVAIFPSLKQRLIFALCSLTKKNTTYVQYCYELTNCARTFIWLMPGSHTMNYTTYVQYCYELTNCARTHAWQPYDELHCLRHKTNLRSSFSRCASAI